MRRTRDIVGLPVLDLRTGNQIGWVQDVVFDARSEEVRGILLEGNHLFQQARGIPREAIAAIGKDALTVSDAMVQEIAGPTWSQKIGNHVYTQSGDGQGTIQDVFLDDRGQRVVGYEVSDGLWTDIVCGRGAVWQQHVMVDGENVLIVDDQASPWSDNTKGGLPS